MNTFTVTSENSDISCPIDISDTIICSVFVSDDLSLCNVEVMVERPNYSCNDISHAILPSGKCLPICPYYSSYPQDELDDCVIKRIIPGYWYDNGFRQFVTSCPIGHCNHILLSFDESYANITRDSQCSNNWRGLACGECDYSAGYAIKYDTTECIPVDECLTTSVTYSLVILFMVSLFYWIAIISFIFVLLHFKLDITAGYAYGLLFYYSVLEQLVNDVTSQFTRNLESSYNNGIDDMVHDFSYFDLNYEFMRLKVLPFLSTMGNLKPPFTGFMRLCFGDAKVIDHLMLGYIHPLMVTFLVVIIYILARNFVLVARTIGRYVNSKSICILLLLSYSSITYTSMQLLKSLPVFEVFGSVTRMQVYWSPTVKYFSGRHILYGIIAILCELIIGIGFPLVLIFQRYLIRYCNINFTSLNLITDQLKGCYKEEYRWFAAYYLICRQIVYGVNDLIDYCLGFWTTDYTVIVATPFPKFTIMLILYISIMMIHVLFQPYKRKVLNILDNFILLTLVGLLVNSLEVYWNKFNGIVFWFLPLLIFLNYFAYFTKLKHLTIPCSCAVVFGTTFLFTWCGGVFAILFLASSSIIFIVYIICVIKCLCTRCRRTTVPIYVAINEQNDEIDESNNNSSTEVRIIHVLNTFKYILKTQCIHSNLEILCLRILTCK